MTDMKKVLDLLATLDNVTDANIRLPPSIHRFYPQAKEDIASLRSVMERRIPAATNFTHIETPAFKDLEIQLERRMTIFFQHGIRRITENGRYWMFQDDWDYLMQRPLYVGFLDSSTWLDATEKWHYVWPEGPQNRDWDQRPRQKRWMEDRQILLVASDHYWELIQRGQWEAVARETEEWEAEEREAGERWRRRLDF
ncbi:MAG: hypothetical protein Q9220_005045 [cf. Caloplaca sp. 1 TL-2023]